MAIVYSGDKLKSVLEEKGIKKLKYQLYNLSENEDTLDSLNNQNLYFIVRNDPTTVVECKLFKTAKEVDESRNKPLKNYEEVQQYEMLKGIEINKYNGFYEDLNLVEFYSNRLNGKAVKKEDIDEQAFYLMVSDDILKVKMEI
ncbi:hypothetical protein [Aquibacillus salsiterrae]|uniref:Uncharacterized protein n=1 Tax=Aquibacillus salsiterrae TaxID=2950439 RepID=A0A9X3WE79_9BACI|nr:hypothetical protein [Aquibacillus salsiterrae]MDC3418092.1 hypothetical protein [Aquibacillus salsiterrae]